MTKTCEVTAFVDGVILRGVEKSDDMYKSIDLVFDKVERPARVKIEALDLDGKTFTLEADGLLAVCIQHEMDHLDGKLFVDYLSPLKRQRIREKIAKAERIREKEKVKVRR